MPIQPLVPTLRLNSRENDPFPPYGEKVPAAISSRRKARTSSRNALAWGGSSTGSKRKLKLIGASRSCGDEGPEPVDAALRDHPPETRGPDRLVAELLAPSPQAARRVVQRVLVGEAHRAVNLMGDRRAGAGRLAAAHLGDRDLTDRDVRARARLGGSVGRSARRRYLARQHRQIVLNRLELGDRAPELRAVERVLHRLLEDLFERPGHLLQADRGPEADEQILIDGRRTHGHGHAAVE